MVTEALCHGLKRSDPDALTAFRNGDVRFTFVYYGDILNEVLLACRPDLEEALCERDELHYGQNCEAEGSLDACLSALFAQKQFGKKAWHRFLETRQQQPDLSRELTALLGLSDPLLQRALPEMAAYLRQRRVGSEIRARLLVPLRDALMVEEDICLIGHGLGCIVAYDVLWKLSQMSEYREVQEKAARVSLWMTLGNPLGHSGVKHHLYDRDEYGEGRYPRYILRKWLDIAACDDFIASGEDMASCFRPMLDMGFLDRIKDLPPFYAFWRDENGPDPHRLYGYLDHPEVADQIVRWIFGVGDR